MRKIFLLLSLFCLFAITPTSSNAQTRKSSKSYKPKTVHVRSYTTKKGKNVKSHYRSKPSKRKHAYMFFEAIDPRRLVA